MEKLHQLLPIESDLAGRAKRILNETLGTFTKKAEHFTGHVRTLEMFDDARTNENATEVKAITTTVDAKLQYMHRMLSPYYSAMVDKEATNQSARADVVIDDVVLMSNVPATALLAFESRLKDVRTVYEHIPTLVPGINWISDASRNGVFVDENPRKTMKTEKVLQFKEVSPATNQHKAQVETWHADKPVGSYVQTSESGALTPGEKSARLSHIDKLIAAVKSARQAANCEEVKKAGEGIGATIAHYILAG